MNRRTFGRYLLATSTFNACGSGIITAATDFFLKKNSHPPKKYFFDDFSVPTKTGEGIYRFSGTGSNEQYSIPFYSSDGPNGAPSLNCVMPSELIPYTDSRSNIVCLLRNTDFNGDFEMEWGQTYGFKQTFKLMRNGAEDGYRCIFFQTHTPKGAPKGSSPLLGLRCTPGEPVKFYINGDENRLKRTDIIINNSDIFDRWCTLMVDLRYNYGSNEYLPGFARLYLTIGDSTNKPPDPGPQDQIHSYDGNIGLDIAGHGPGYFVGGIYEILYKKGSPTNETAMELILDEIIIQDAAFHEQVD